MSVRRVPEVAALVLAGRGGLRLARVLDSVAWAGERVVLDPAARLAAAALPPGVRRSGGTGDLGEIATAPWLLLVVEDEVVSSALAAAIAAAVAAPACGAYRITREVRGFGAVLRVGAPVRLARREEAALVLRPGLGPALWVPGARRGRLAPALEGDAGDALATAVEDLEADAAALAGMLRAAEHGPLVRTAVASTMVAGARVLLARGRRTSACPGPWARWFLAVLAGYRAMVAYAKLWETLRAEAAALR